MRHHDSYGTVITFEPAMIIGIEYWSAVMRMSRQPPRDHRVCKPLSAIQFLAASVAVKASVNEFSR